MGLCLNRSWLDNWIRKFAQKTGFADAKCLEWGYLIQFNDNAFISSRTVGRWKGISGLTSRLISLHTISNVVLIILKCLNQSLSSKWFGIITS